VKSLQWVAMRDYLDSISVSKVVDTRLWRVLSASLTVVILHYCWAIHGCDRSRSLLFHRSALFTHLNLWTVLLYIFQSVFKDILVQRMICVTTKMWFIALGKLSATLWQLFCKLSPDDKGCPIKEWPEQCFVIISITTRNFEAILQQYRQQW